MERRAPDPLRSRRRPRIDAEGRKQENRALFGTQPAFASNRRRVHGARGNIF